MPLMPPRPRPALAAAASARRRALLPAAWLLVVGGLCSATVTVAQPPTAWSVVPSANVGGVPTNALNAISCITARDCWAIGTDTDAAHLGHPLTEHWNGATWTIVAAPEVTGIYNALDAVSCPATDACLAVGYTYDSVSGITRNLAERWNGTQWSIVATADVPAVTNDVLWSVACTATDDCWAVGSGADATTGFKQTVIEHDTGSGLAIVASPNSAPVEDNALDGVTCVSKSLCWAVGSHKDPSNSAFAQTLIARWDGASWASVTSADTLPTQTNLLLGVSCAGASDCWAVGNYQDGSAATSSTSQTLAEHWDGSHWTVAPSAGVANTGGDYLKGVKCVSASDCVAVGLTFRAGGTGTLVEQWNGTAWTLVSSQDPNPTYYNFLSGVDCASATACFAAGYYLDSANNVKNLIKAPSGSIVQASLDPFTFVTRTNVGTDTLATSEDVTLSGASAGGLAVSVVAGDHAMQYSLDDGLFTADAGTAKPGQKLAVRHRSATTAGASVTTSITVGDYTTHFTSTTTTLDHVPDAFDFGTQQNVAGGQPVASAIVTPTGYDTAQVAPSAGASYRLDGGAWTTAVGTIARGQTLQARHTGNAASLGYTRTYVTVGGVRGTFTTRSRK